LGNTVTAAGGLVNGGTGGGGLLGGLGNKR
jgi:hypothetical protein